MRRVIWMVALLGIASVQAQAQMGRPFDMRFERVEQLRKVRMIDELDLKEEQSVRFFARLKEFDTRRHELMREKHELLNQIEQMLKDKAEPGELEKVFPSVVAIDQRMAAEREKFFAGLTDILTVEQRARLLTFERRFEKDLRDAVRDTQRRRMKSDEQ